MNDFSHQLGNLLDDVANGIDPTPDFEAACAANVPVVPNAFVGGLGFRRAVGVAAASVALLAGGVAAYETVSDRGPVDPAVADDAGADLGIVIARVEDPPVDAAEPAAGEADRSGGDPGVADGDLDEGDETEDKLDESGDVATTASTTIPPDAIGAERTAKLGALTVVDGVAVQVLEGKAATREAVAVRSDHGPTSVGIATDGTWRIAMRLPDLEIGGVTELVVSFGWGDAQLVFEVAHPGPTTTLPPKPEPPTTEPPKPEPPPTTQPPKPEPPKPEPPKPQPPAPEPPKPPEDEPKPIAFTSNLGSPYQDETYMKQVFYGTAPAGAKVIASSDWGAVDTTANDKGQWEMQLKLTGVPDGTVVHVVVSASTGGSVGYDLVRVLPEPVHKEFTSTVGDIYDNAEYFKPVLYGTGSAGSIVHATSEYGSASVEVGTNGHWELWFKQFDVPNGVVGIRVTNSASESVFEHSVERTAAPGAESAAFTASAALSETDADPAVNEYWGTAQPGATVFVSSDFGGGQTVADANGNWEIRVEFPTAPANQAFGVLLTNSASEVAFEKSFKRIVAT